MSIPCGYVSLTVFMLQELRSNANHSPPLDSSGSSVNSESNLESPSSTQEEKSFEAFEGDLPTQEGKTYEPYEGDLDLVTCYCGKPFAGRPMIECSFCLTWIHLSCARIKKRNIPDVSHFCVTLACMLLRF